MLAGAALPGPSPFPDPAAPVPEGPLPLPGPPEPEVPVAEAVLDGIPEGREAVPDIMVVMGPGPLGEAFEAFGAADVPEAEAGGAVEAADGL